MVQIDLSEPVTWNCGSPEAGGKCPAEFIRLLDRLEMDHPHPPAERTCRRGGNLNGQTGLANPRRSDERHES